MNFTGSGSGKITSTESGTSTPCDDGIDGNDCTANLSGPINFSGVGKGTLSAALTIAWHSARLSDIGGLVCAAASGAGTLAVQGGSLTATFSGSECETAAGSAVSPHVFNGTLFAQGPSGPSSVLTVAGNSIISDSGTSPSTGAGTYILGATGVFQKAKAGAAPAAQVNAVNDNSNPTGFAFDPSSVTVAKGGTVTFQNMTGADHSVIWDTSGAPANLPLFDPGNSVSAVMHSAGTFKYHCGVHGPAMHGSITVTQ